MDSTPKNRYQTILADPPWDIQQRGTRGAVRAHRPMSGLEIGCLPVGNLAEPNAQLWLWTTSAIMPLAMGVMQAWGFTPRSYLTWVKPRLRFENDPWIMKEYLLLGTRGQVSVHLRYGNTWLFAPAQEHSHKPEEVYAVIERCSPGPYLELFARRRQPGWDVWGDEITDPDIAMPEPGVQP